MTPPRQQTPWWTDTAIRVAIGYLIFAGLWIYCSDWLLAHWFKSTVELSHWQTVKGGAFVAITSTLLFVYLRYCLRRQQQAYNELTTLFDSFAGLIYVADFQNHDLLYVNRFAMERFGSEWHGRKCYSYFQTDQQNECGFCTNALLLREDKPGPPVTWEFRNTRDGRWYQCHDKAVLWADGRLARMEIAIDITEHKELEHIKDELLSAVNHEMRTPLTAISGFSELLCDDPTIPEHTRQHLQTIFDESEKLKQLIENFMEVRRLKTDRSRINYAPFKATELLAAASDRQHDCSKRHLIEVDVPEELVLYGNHKELTQAFRQLVANACRFSPEGGRVLLRGKQVGKMAQLTVTDQGIGIPAEERQRIFEPFHRLDTGDRRRSRGVGLGLALAREILLLHGGEIQVEEAPEGGNRFVVTLPLPSQQQSVNRQTADAR